MDLEIPDFALVLMMGPSGAGKSTFAARNFKETEIVSSDRCRALISDDESDQSVTAGAFALVGQIADLRLAERKLTVIDATSVRREDRAKLLAIARERHAPTAAIALDMDPKLCHQRNQSRPGRGFGLKVPAAHSKQLRDGLAGLAEEGFAAIHVLRAPEEAARAQVRRVPLPCDARRRMGPFDLIGDVHGCFEELTALLKALGYKINRAVGGERPIGARHPEGRMAIFLGDLTDRGPRSVDCLRLAMGMVDEGAAFAVTGNHDHKLAKWLSGRKVAIAHGLATTVEELTDASPAFRDAALAFLETRPDHLWLAGGALVAAHAGLPEAMQGRSSKAVKSFALFGDVNGDRDADGLPVRRDWAQAYRGAAEVIYGHTPLSETAWVNRTLCLDTGCVFGGALSALRWPEREIRAVPARRRYAAPKRPLAPRLPAPA